MTDRMATRMPIGRSPTEQALELFLRSVALFCLFQGVAYWVQLLGLFEGAEWRFDLMPAYWQVTAAPLAVLFPFAAVGLWMLTSWGPVIWFLCAAAETAMYGIFPELYGFRPWLIALHLSVAGFYTLMRVLLYLGRRSRD